MKINVNAHSSIKIDNIYFDPYNIKEEQHDAKYIFLTHTHYDHLSLEDINKVISPKTIFIATFDAKETLENNYQNKIIFVKPFDNISLKNLEVEVLPAYNTNKSFHKKSENWVGYKIVYSGKTLAILGDTDLIPELKNLSCDVLFIPIGGTYTMNAKEAATLANAIMPQIAVPTHYNLIVGNKKDEEVFLKNLLPTIQPKIYI